MDHQRRFVLVRIDPAVAEDPQTIAWVKDKVQREYGEDVEIVFVDPWAKEELT